MHDRKFQSAKQVFYGMIRTLEKQGLVKTIHKSAISEEKFVEMYASGVLSPNPPESLLNKVFVEIMLPFCRWGKEGLRQLKKSSFVRTNDSHGRVYITLAFSELEKNHQGFHKHDYPEEPRMYAQAGNNCTVRSFDLYNFS